MVPALIAKHTLSSEKMFSSRNGKIKQDRYRLLGLRRFYKDTQVGKQMSVGQ